MSTVGVRFEGGPADGEVAQLPADADGRPPANWVWSHRADDGAEHLYANGGRDAQGGWTMRFVRSDPVGMVE
jgi:hypothetical protein